MPPDLPLPVRPLPPHLHVAPVLARLRLMLRMAHRRSGTGVTAATATPWLGEWLQCTLKVLQPHVGTTATRWLGGWIQCNRRSPRPQLQLVPHQLQHALRGRTTAAAATASPALWIQDLQQQAVVVSPPLSPGQAAGYRPRRQRGTGVRGGKKGI